MTYFTDRDLGNAFPDILQAAGIPVERHSAHFNDDSPDEEWLGTVGQRGWIILTHNWAIRYTDRERDAVFLARARMLILIGHARQRELAENFVRTHVRVERFLAAHPMPLIAKIYRPDQGKLRHNPQAPGRIEMWLSEDAWRRMTRF